jgi:hypothetical protein
VIDEARAAALLAFLAAGPGLGWVRLLAVPSLALRWALVVAVSLAADTIVATALLYAGAWSPGLGLAVLLAVAAAGLVAGRLPLRRRVAGP